LAYLLADGSLLGFGPLDKTLVHAGRAQAFEEVHILFGHKIELEVLESADSRLKATAWRERLATASTFIHVFDIRQHSKADFYCCKTQKLV